MELEGFEPSSKQGVSALSTCLFQPGLSGVAKTWTTKRHLILKNFTRAARQTLISPDLPAPPVPQSRNKDLGVMSCQPPLAAD